MAEFVTVGAVSDFPPGCLKGIRIQREEVGVANVGGKLYAFSNECTHSQAHMSHGFVKDQTHEIVCIQHWAIFSLDTGAVLQGPAYENLPVYEVRVVGDEVQIALPQREEVR